MPDLADDLDALLAAEREAILAADFESLNGLLEEKERLMGEIAAPNRADRTRLRRIARKAERNGELLLSLARGIRAAGRRVREIREGGAGVYKTYSQAGECQALTGPAGKLERRA